MQRHPSHHADDIGARSQEPSGFTVLMRTTAVPKYRIAGLLVTCIAYLR